MRSIVRKFLHLPHDFEEKGIGIVFWLISADTYEYGRIIVVGILFGYGKDIRKDTSTWHFSLQSLLDFAPPYAYVDLTLIFRLTLQLSLWTGLVFVCERHLKRRRKKCLMNTQYLAMLFNEC